MRRLKFCLLMLLMPGQPAQGASLDALLEQVWQRQPQFAQRSWQEQQLALRLAQGQQLLAGPATASVRYTTDQAGEQQGLRHWEGEISVPLWRPGQRADWRAAASAEQAAWLAAGELERWKLAGELRDLLWQREKQRAEVTAAEEHVAALDTLAQDTARRVQAGDLPPLELNLVRLAQGSARRSLLQAQLRWQQEDQTLRRLTGTAVETAPQPETVAAQDAVVSAEHPALAAAHQALLAARARGLQARSERSSAPELTFGWAHERDGRSESANQLLSIGLRLPLGTVPAAEQAVLQLAGEQAAAAQQLEQTRLQLQSVIDAARQHLQTAQQTLELLQHDEQLARQNRDWLARAFNLGEQGLPPLLQAEATLASARAELQRARLELAHATARLNQALGVMP